MSRQNTSDRMRRPTQRPQAHSTTTEPDARTRYVSSHPDLLAPADGSLPHGRQPKRHPSSLSSRRSVAEDRAAHVCAMRGVETTVGYMTSPRAVASINVSFGREEHP
jgi:hypothetical protein